jgi:putative methionine-R-sulfoxide reductase with GAF domain
MSRARLRWLAVWAPTAFFALLTGMAILLRPHAVPSSALFFLVLGLASGGAYVFSRFVFANIQRQEAEIIQRNLELEALNAVGEVLDRSLRVDDVLPGALDTILGTTGVEAGEIFLWDEGTGEMVLRAHLGPFPEAFRQVVRFKPGEGFPGRVAALGKPIVVHDLAEEPGFVRAEVVAKGFRAFASVSLRAKDKVVGVLNIASFDRRRPTPEEMRLLTAVGHQLGIAIRKLPAFGGAPGHGRGERASAARPGDARLPTPKGYPAIALLGPLQLARSGATAGMAKPLAYRIRSSGALAS